MLNLNQLKTFVAIVEAGGFREAAGRLKISQSTASQQLQKLEDELGATLVVRDRVHSSPTASGARLLPFARSLLNAAEHAHDVVAGGRLVVGASSNIGIYLLQPFVARYAREHGATNTIDLRIAPNPEIGERLSNGELDAAVMEWWDRRPGFSARLWRQEPMVVIVAPDHRFAKHKAVKPEWLFEEAMVGGEAGTGTGMLLQKIFGRRAANLPVAMTLGSTEAVKAAVRAGLGISLVFASAVESEVRTGALRALTISGIKVQKDLYVIEPEDTPPLSPSHSFSRMLTASSGG